MLKSAVTGSEPYSTPAMVRGSHVALLILLETLMNVINVIINKCWLLWNQFRNSEVKLFLSCTAGFLFPL
jgi:hypothetical protein